jgi:hypothetical protein
VAAASRIAPALLSGAAGAGSTALTAAGRNGGGLLATAGVPGHSGRWVRRGQHIVLFGV